MSERPTHAEELHHTLPFQFQPEKYSEPMIEATNAKFYLKTMILLLGDSPRPLDKIRKVPKGHLHYHKLHARIFTLYINSSSIEL